MLLEEILKKSESKVIDESFVKEIKEAFDSAVSTKAESKATELFEAKEADYSKTLDEMVDTVAKSIQEDNKAKFNSEVESKVQEIVEAYGAELKTETEKELTESLATLEEKVFKYLDYGVKQFVEEAMPTWNKEKDVLKAKKLQEEFKDLAEVFGAKINTMNESDEIGKVNEELDKNIDTINALEDTIKGLKKDSMLKEAVLDLDVVKTDKFNSLMEAVVYVSESEFKSKIDLYKVAVDSSKTPENVNEDKKDKITPSWKR